MMKHVNPGSTISLKALTDHRARLGGQVSELRRALARQSPLAFAKLYLPANVPLPPSSMHLALSERLAAMTTQRSARVAIAAPRGHAKSTLVSLAYVLWCICYGLEPFILLISATLDQATDFLSQVKKELASNPRILEDFPEVAEPPGVAPPAPRWRKEEIITRNDIKVTALGADKQIRGRLHRQHRPSLIILDDVENELEVRSDEQRRRKEQWFFKAVLKAGSPITNVIVIGTILHYDSLLCNLVGSSDGPRKHPGWDGLRYQAVLRWSPAADLWARWERIFGQLELHEGEQGPQAASRFFEANREAMLEGTEVLWPQREDYLQLMTIRFSEGRAAFDSEKQNEPVNPEDCLFQESDLHYWDDQYDDEQALIRSFTKGYSFFGACDPSLGKEGKHGDDSAIVTLVRDHATGILYVLDADIRRRKPDQLLEDILQRAVLRNHQAFAMETNQFQDFLADELQRLSGQRSVYLSVRKLTNTSDKLGRIQGLQPLVTSGAIRLSRRHVQLTDELRQFPMGRRDDGLDALEMAVRIARQGPSSGKGKVGLVRRPRLTDMELVEQMMRVQSGYFP